MTDLVERLRGPAPHMIGPLIDEAADEIERLERLTARQEGLIERLRIELAEERAKPKLMAEHDDYVIRANANVCELNRDIERLRAHINTLIQERDAERQTYNDAIARHLSEIKRLKAQLARTETALDNEFNNGIALCAEIERLKMEAKVMK